MHSDTNNCCNKKQYASNRQNRVRELIFINKKDIKIEILDKNMIKKVPVKIKLLHSDAKIPTLGTEHAAGFDIYSIEDYELQPGETHAITTGIALEVPEGKCVQIWDRSGMGFKGIHRFAGLIDSDYRGEFKIILFNSTKQVFKIAKGDRICQAIIVDYYKPEFEEINELSESKRGENWNSSTGR
jgi:dUTP pyrophosphatase